MPLTGAYHRVSYAGHYVLACDFLVLPGPDPSIAVLTVIPQPGVVIPKNGHLVLNDGAHEITYYDCAIDDHRLEVVKDSRGGSIWYVGVMDRRWKWKYQYISGIYNKRLPNGEFDILYTDDGNPFESPPPQKKSFKQLCQLLLTQMQESTVDVEDLPADIYPAVAWDYANPAQELEKLCAAFGRMLVLGQDNLVHIVEKGGAGTIDEAGATNPDHYYNSGVRPAKLMLVGGKTVVEAAYYLTPVGYERDMTVKSQMQLSYSPTGGTSGSLGGWELRDAFNLQWIVDGNDRSAAYASVYRKFRPWALVDAYGAPRTTWTGVEGENRETSFTNIDQVLPLWGHLCDPPLWTTYSSYGAYAIDRHKRPHAPHVKWAYVRPLSLSSGIINYSDYSAFFLPDCDVDLATGTVTFQVPLTITTYTSLMLSCAHNVKHRTTGQWMRFTKTVNVPNGVSGTEIIRDESLVRTVIYQYEPDVYKRGPKVTLVTNEAELQTRADVVLSEALRKYTEHDQDTELIGFVPMEPESHIKWVHYQMRYNDAAFTTVRYTVDLSGA